MDYRVVLITGATDGIGAEVARQLAVLGATVIVSARDPEQARVTAGELGVDALPVGLDVTDERSVQAAAARLDRLDVLVNNAAADVDWSETATGADLEAAHLALETNLFGAWRLTKAVLPLLERSAHPRIVNVSSGAGSFGDARFGLTRRHGAAASYGISKAALNALTSTLAAELAGTRILVNAVCPGLSETYPGAEALGAHPVEDGARSIVWAATLPDDGPSGELRRCGVTLPW